MIGDNVCNMQCFSQECEWDGLDCGCAVDCLRSEYGQCKAACLVPDCNYDAMADFPHCDEITRTAAKYHQLSTRSFAHTFTYDTVCIQQSSFCLAANWLQSYTTCVSPCNNTSCVYSFGNCGADCTVLRHCAICETQELPSCLKCMSGYVNFYGNCMSRCPVGYEVHGLVTDICYPTADVSTEASPQRIYVQSEANEDGDGSYSHPFDSVSLALTSIRTQYTIIYLLSGEHNLTVSSSSLYLKAISSSPLSFQSDSSVILTSWTCTKDTNTPPHSLCATTNPILLYQNLHPVIWTIYGHFSIIGVDLEGGTSIVPGCMTEMCSYCPFVAVTTGGIGISDQRVRMAPGTFAPVEKCAKFHTKGLFWISEGAFLVLKDLKIANFRQEFSSLINLTSASVLLQNVSISNIVISASSSDLSASFQSTSALIHQQNPNQNLYLPGRIQLIDVSVSLLGNGFEYNSDLTQGGFLNIQGLDSVLITRLSVSLSVVYGNFLVNIGNFSQLKLEDCVFDRVFVGASMVKIAPVVHLSKDSIVDGLPSDYYMNHLVLTHLQIVHCSSFQYSSSSQALLSIVFNGQIYSTRLQDLVISDSYSDGYLLSVSNIGVSLSSDRTNIRSGLVLSTGERIHFLLPKKQVLFQGVHIEASVSAGPAVVLLTSLPNVAIAGLNVTNSGDARNVESVNTKTVESLVKDRGTYMKLLVGIEAVSHCGNVISLDRLYNVSIEAAMFTNTSCLQASSTPGIHTSSLEGRFLASEVTFQALTTLSTSLPCCLLIDTSGLISLIGLRISACEMHDQGAVVVLQSGPAGVEIQDCVFEGNRAQGAVVRVLAAYSLRVQNCSFTHNYSPSDIGIYFRPELNLASASIFLTNLTFEDNTGLLVQLMNDVNDPVPVLLSFQHIHYTRNIGTAISMDSSNIIVAGSLIAHCRFVDNHPHTEVTLLSFQHGALRLEDCWFEDNSVDDKGCVSVVFLWEGEKKYVTVASCTFRGNACPGIYYISDTPTSLLTLINNTYERNQAIAVYASGGIFTDLNSTFLYTNTSAVTINAGSQATITQAQFRHSVALHGGAVFIEGESTGLLQDCEFNNNTAEYGGAIYVEQSSKLIGRGLLFERNQAGLRGSAVYFFGTTKSNELSDCNFRENWSMEGGTIVALSSVLSLSNSRISFNQAPVASGLLCYFSTVTVSNCSFSDQQSNTGVFIYCAMESLLVVQSSSFTRGKAAIQGGAIYILSAVVAIIDCDFKDLSGSHGALMAVNARAEFNITNTVVTGVSAEKDLGGIVYSMESSGFVANCSFQHYQNGAIVGYQLLSLSVLSTNFHSNS